MSHLTTHVLDAALGTPAAGVRITLVGIAEGVTDADGRLSLGPELLEPRDYELVFETAEYLGDRPGFYPRVSIHFTVTGPEHYHVPLLLSPFAYSTYRGS